MHCLRKKQVCHQHPLWSQKVNHLPFLISLRSLGSFLISLCKLSPMHIALHNKMPIPMPQRNRRPKSIAQHTTPSKPISQLNQWPMSIAPRKSQRKGRPFDFHVVVHGRCPRVYDCWLVAAAQVIEFEWSIHQGFYNGEEAEDFYQRGIVTLDQHWL